MQQTIQDDRLLLSQILETHQSHIKFDEAMNLYEIPVFNGIDSNCIRKLVNYGFIIHSVLRYVNCYSSVHDVFLRVAKRD